MTPVKAVFFDIGNVLLFFDKQKVAECVRTALRRPEYDVEACFWTGAKSVTAPSESGLLSPRQTYEAFREKTGYRGSFFAFKTLWCEQFTVNRPAAAALARLSKVMPVYLLSNTNAIHWEHFKKRYVFPRQVKGAVLSFEVGACKPDPAIYRAAVKMAGVRAAECFFLDDLPANVAAARAFGMKAEVYEPMRAKSLLASLSSMSVQRPQAVS